MRPLPVSRAGIVLAPTGNYDGNAVGLKRVPADALLNPRPGRGLLVVGGEPVPIQVPHVARRSDGRPDRACIGARPEPAPGGVGRLAVHAADRTTAHRAPPGQRAVLVWERAQVQALPQAARGPGPAGHRQPDAHRAGPRSSGRSTPTRASSTAGPSRG